MQLSTYPTKRILTQVWNCESVKPRSSTMPEILAAAIAFLDERSARRGDSTWVVSNGPVQIVHDVHDNQGCHEAQIQFPNKLSFFSFSPFFSHRAQRPRHLVPWECHDSALRFWSCTCGILEFHSGRCFKLFRAVRMRKATHRRRRNSSNWQDSDITVVTKVA